MGRDEWTDGWSEGAEGYWGGGVGGQRLKLHHKSHPERKHGVTPPPLPYTAIHSSPLSPLRPSPLLSPPLCLPPLRLFLWTESAPRTGQVYFILLLHVLQTPNLPLSPDPLPPLLICHSSSLFPPSTSLLRGNKSLSGPDQQRWRGKTEAKHVRQASRWGNSWIIFAN